MGEAVGVDAITHKGIAPETVLVFFSVSLPFLETRICIISKVIIPRQTTLSGMFMLKKETPLKDMPFG